MKQTTVNKSKKGFSLPLAIAISAFMILISSSLIFIAMNSLSTTSSDVSGRQAYMNAKSALEYARVYYEKNGNYSSIGTQYLIMKDSGGSISQGARIDTNDNATKNATTYVIAEYKSAEGNGFATLKLRAFSKYSDAFGNKAKTASVSGTFIIGGTRPRRLTVIARDQNPRTSQISDKITLNVKQPKDMNYQLSYYVWTYKDPERAYQNYKESNGDNSFEYDYHVNVDKLNAATMKNNIVMPNGVWAAGGDGKQGPPAIMSKTSSNNSWISGDYVIRKNRVPWFNIIFAQKGSVLGNSVSNIYNSQTNEMFHLWYLDPDDKNIYFEFTGKLHSSGGVNYYTKYYTGKNWNGKDGLEDTVLVYVKNMKTAVHFKEYGVDNKKTGEPSVPASQRPVISSVVNHDGSTINTGSKSYIYSGQNKKNNNIKMEYEGCGWYVANVETNKTFDLAIRYKNQNYYTPNGVSPSTQDDTWIVLRDGSLNVYATEKSAIENGLKAYTEEDKNNNLGVDVNDYVTVHAKVADYSKGANPKLSYSSESWNSSAGMIRLRNKIVEVSDVNEADFTPESYQNFKTAVDEGITILNTENFIVNQTGSDYEEKMKNANKAYDEAVDKIVRAFEKLDPVDASPEVVGVLDELVRKGNDVVAEQEEKGTYDYTVYVSFIANSSPYKVAKNALENNSDLTASEVTTMTENLRSSLDNIYANTLNRLVLGGYITKAESMVNDSKYKQAARTTLSSKLNNAKNVYNQLNISQSTINDAADELLTQINQTEAALENPLNLDVLNELRTQAQEKLSGEKINCTDQTYNALQTAYNNSSNASSAQNQQKIDEYVNDLSDKLDKFTVTKPETSNDYLAQQNKIKVWIVNKSGLAYDFYKYANSDDEQPNVETSIDMMTAAGYNYSELDKNLYTLVAIKLTKADGSTVLSDPFYFSDSADGNLVIVIDEEGNVTKSTFTTVFFPAIQGGITASLNNGGTPVEPVYEAPYYVFRYLTTNNDFKVNVKWTDASGTTHDDSYPMGKLTAGEFVAVPGNPNTNTPSVNVASVYPKYNNSNPESPAPGGIVYNGDDYQIVDVATSYANYVPGVTVGENQTCVILDSSGSASGILSEGYPRIYAWDHSGKPMVGNNWDARPEMKKSSNPQYYYYVFNNNFKGLKVTKKYNDFSAQDIIVRANSYDQTYKYVLLTSKATPGYFDVWKEISTSTSDDSSIDTSQNLTTVFGDIVLGANQSVIIVHCVSEAAGLTNAGQAPKIYCWGGAAGGTLGAGWPGQSMIKYKNTNYYYHVVSSEVIGCKVNYQSGAHYSGDGESNNINLRASSEDHYKYYLLEPTGSGHKFNVNKRSYDNAPVIDDTPEDLAPEDMDGTELSLRYVGGTKVRIQNMGYYKIFGSGKKTNHFGWPMNNKALSGTDSRYYDNRMDSEGGPGGYMFGGDQGNACSDGRIGASELSAYYDWYEYKIPVAKETDYTFELTGMNANDPNRKTVQIKDAYGDIWISQLDNSTKSGGRYSNIELLTFDPEDDTKPAITEKLAVYFRMPEGWSNLVIEAHGTGGNDTRTLTESNRLTRSGNQNIYAITNISKNTPFITFRVKDASGKDQVYKTSLRGGYFTKFDPMANGGNGDWVEFQSDQDALQEALKTVMGMYYGDVIISQYDENGEVVDRGEDSYFYSDQLRQSFISYANKINSNGVEFYQLKSVEGESEVSAYNAATNINRIINEYKDLFKAMGDARGFISSPIVNGKHPAYTNSKYPEYLSMNTAKSYTTASMTTLKHRLEDAENAYISGDESTVVAATKKLRRAISEMSVEDVGEIAVVLYDAQEKVSKGTSFKIRYKDSPTGSYITVPVTDKNPEKFPIIFIKTTASENAIYDVQFLQGSDNVPLGSPKDKITKDDEAMVFVDTQENPYWIVNSAEDYRDIHATEIEQESSSDTMVYKMKTVAGSLKTMILNFHYDVEVTRINGTSYVIKAGEYSFENGDSGPMSSGSLDLFSSAAEAYFTNSKNYGYYTENVTTAQNMKWYYDYETVPDNQDPGFKNGSNRTAVRNVNFETFDDMAAITKSYPYEYSTTQGLNFRWSAQEELKATSKVTLTAESIKFGVNGGIVNGVVGKGTNRSSGKNMFLFNKIGSDTMDIEFLTDVTVVYWENGEEVTFPIYAGEYTIEKEDPNQDYIANLFDKHYWKSMEHVFPKNNSNGNIGHSTGKSNLVNPTYDD